MPKLCMGTESRRPRHSAQILGWALAGAIGLSSGWAQAQGSEGGTVAQAGTEKSGPDKAGPEDETQRLADEAFERGLTAVSQKRWEDAFTEYTKAFALRKTTYLAANLGTVEHTLGHFALAAEHLSLALTVEEPPKFRNNHRKWLADAKTKIATVTLAGVPAGSQVLVDGKEKGIAPLPTPVFLEPGKHAVEVRFQKVNLAKSYEAVAGGNDTIDFALDSGAPAPLAARTDPFAPKTAVPSSTGSQPPPASTTEEKPVVSPEVPPPPPARRSNAARTGVLITEGALAGTALILGLAFRLRGASLDSEAAALQTKLSRGECSSSTSAPPHCKELQEKRDDGEAANRLTAGFTVAGGVLAAATVGTWLLWKPKKQETVMVRAVPQAGAGYVGLGILGRF